MPDREDVKADKLVYWILGFFGSMMVVILSAVISSNASYKAGIDARVNTLEVQIGINTSNSSEIQRRLVRIEDKLDTLEKSVHSSQN
jgi:hypothetical protein